MRRLPLIAALLGGLALFAGQATFAQDKITYANLTTKAAEQVEGTIQEETPAGIKIKLKGGAVKTIPALDVQEVLYKTSLADLDFRQPFGKEARALKAGTKDAERRALLAEALKEFKDLAPKVKGTPNAYRYVQFKMAQVLTEQARDDPAQTKAAIDALTAYKTDNPGGWEILPCLKILAQLHEQQGDTDAATKTYGELAAIPEAPKEMKLESDLLVARMLMRGRKYADAEKKLQSVRQGLPADDPRAAIVQVLLAQSQLEQNNLGAVEAQVKSALAGTSDNLVRAVAHNTLGEYYLRGKQEEEAFWQFLRVDVLYNQDKAEHAKALYHLSKLFDRPRNDPARARECRDRLLDKQFAGTEYQRRAESEK